MSEFSTEILTSKSPEEVADFLNNSLDVSSTLIQKNLLVWFSTYASMIARYNKDLNTLIVNGRSFFPSAGAEFGSIDKIWNCVASCVMSHISVNESVLKTIHAEVLGPFSSIFKEDFKYSELMINSKELSEMVDQIHSANDSESSTAAYNWNAKAPAILTNFENYKRYEKSILFSGLVAYLNAVNAKTASLLSKNENAVNFIMKEYNIENEMENYAAYMIAANIPSTRSVSSATHPAPVVSHSNIRSSRQSIASSNGGESTSVKDKRKSKLMLKVGSILGRKKKKDHVGAFADNIPEDHSISSTGHQVSRAATRNSIYQSPSSVPATGGFAESPAKNSREKTGTSPEDSVKLVASDPQTLPVAAPVVFNTEPLKPSVPLGGQPVEPRGSPNVETVDSSDDSDVPLDKLGNRVSLLRAHNLDMAPKVETDLDLRSRNTSTGKYSFEYGDEEKSISTPTASKSKGAFPNELPAFNENNEPVSKSMAPSDVVNSNVPTSAPIIGNSPASIFASNTSNIRAPPPPPPSREVNARGEEEKVYNGRTSTNDPSGVPVPSVPGFLAHQTTGNSLLKQEYFKHFESENETLSKTGLNTSIAEIINVTFTKGQVSTARVLGEIAFNYNSSEPKDLFSVKIPTQFTRSLLNDQLMKKSGDYYDLNVKEISGKTLGGIKYLMNLSPEKVPVFVKQIWKFEASQASLIVKVVLNPAYARSVQLVGFMISASLDSSVKSLSASSKPEGSFNSESNRITWRYNDALVLDEKHSEEKFIARIITDGTATESPTGVKVRFAVERPECTFVELLDGDGNELPSYHSLVSGNYVSHF